MPQFLVDYQVIQSYQRYVEAPDRTAAEEQVTEDPDSAAPEFRTAAGPTLEITESWEVQIG
jgi:hypothetical protein